MPSNDSCGGSLAGSVGGSNHGRILEEVLQTPHNANGLLKIIKLDDKTIRHYLDVLEKTD